MARRGARWLERICSIFGHLQSSFELQCFNLPIDGKIFEIDERKDSNAFFPSAIAKVKRAKGLFTAHVQCVHCAAPFHADFLPGAYILYI